MLPSTCPVDRYWAICNLRVEQDTCSGSPDMQLDQLFAAPRRKGSKAPVPLFDDLDEEDEEDEEDKEDKEDEVAVVDLALEDEEP
jgi:hypothetical protein